MSRGPLINSLLDNISPGEVLEPKYSLITYIYYFNIANIS